MDLEQCPCFATELATTTGFDLTVECVMEQALDFRAVAIVALGIGARARVDQEFHRTLNLRRTVFTFSVRHRCTIACRTALSHKRVLVSDADAAGVANIKVWTRFAAPPLAGFKFARTLITGRHKRRFRRVVQVIQHHHRSVFGAAKGIKLEVIALAQRQKCLSRVEELALKFFLFILLLLS